MKMSSMVLIIAFLLLSVPSMAAQGVVVAKVNGAAILQIDLDAEIDTLIPRILYHGTVTDEKRAEFRERALDELVTRELQYQDAVAKGIKPDKKQVKERMKQIQGRYRSKREYQGALEQAGITEDQFQARIEKLIVVEAVVARNVTEPARMSEESLKEDYGKNILKFREPEKIKLRLISTKDESKAKEALAKIAAGEDFGTVAAKTSEDRYRIMGGDIGFVHRGRLLQQIEEVAFSLKVGALSGLIKAEGTWYVLKVEGKVAERQVSFEEAREKLKSELESSRAKELMDKWLHELRSKAVIEIMQITPK